MVIVFFFFFFFIRRQIGHRPFWVGWSQKWDSRLFTSEWSCVFSLRMFDVLKGEKKGWLKMDIIFQSSVCVCVCASVSDHQVDSHMATPSADPCFALASAQLAQGAEQAEPRWPSGTAKRRDLWTRWSHRFCYLSVTLISSFCISSFAMYLLLSVFVAISFLCHYVWYKGSNAQIFGSRS